VTVRDLQLLQGTLDTLVLRAIEDAPLHGYAIARRIRERSGDELVVEDRALYVSLHRMEDRGWVTAEWGISENNRRAKYYELTMSGRRVLERKAAEWARYASAVGRVLAPERLKGA
jgi:transcriptional regulator